VLLAASGSLAVVAVAQVTLAVLIVVASIHVAALLHDAIPSSIRSGVASGVGALSWIVFLPVALAFGLVSNTHGVRSAAWMIIVAAVLASATLVWVALRPNPHRRIAKLVPGYLDGTLDAVAAQHVVDHLATCGGCRTYVEQLRQTIRALADPARERLPDEARDLLLGTLRARTSRVPVNPHGDTGHPPAMRRPAALNTPQGAGGPDTVEEESSGERTP
jgi:hypothetical protein